MENYEGEGDTLRMGIELAVPVCRNEAACKREVVRFEEWMVRLLGGSDKDKQSV